MRLVVSVGTDHHPFDRLIEWVEQWVRAHRADDVTVFVQHGATRPATVGENVSVVGPLAMATQYASATCVVTQGGPGGIADSAAAGVLPIVVPRRPDMGEHVDDHQLRFARFMERAGDVVLAETAESLFSALDSALADPAAWRRAPTHSHSDGAADALGRVVDDVLRRPAGAVRLTRLINALHPGATRLRSHDYRRPREARP